MPGLYSITPRTLGENITPQKYNADHQNHIENATPQMHDDYSASVAQMQTVTDPGEVATESLPTSLAGEIERLRFIIKEITGGAQWYTSPSTSLEAVVTALAARVLKAGDTMTGDFQIVKSIPGIFIRDSGGNGTGDWKIETSSANGGDIMFYENTGTFAAPVFTLRFRISASGTISETTHLTSKSYVDATIASSIAAQPFTAAYSSPAQTITSAGTLTLAHGLGAVPELVQSRLICVTGEEGYSAGDILHHIEAQSYQGANRSKGVSLVVNATNLVIRYGSSTAAFEALNKTSGDRVDLTNANWNFAVRAWV